MIIILKVMRKQADDNDMFVFRNEDRKIQFQRKPRRPELEAMVNSETPDKFFGEFELTGGQSTFIKTTKSRDW